MPESLRPSPVSGCVSALHFRLRLIVTFLSMLAASGAFTAAVGQSRLAETPPRDDSSAAEQSPAAQGAQGQAKPAVPSDQPQGHIHIVPFGRNSGVINPPLAPVGAHLTYFGGPVISNIQVVAVFWGPNVVSAITTNGGIDQFYTDITSSRYFDLLTEYTTAGITGANGSSTSNQTIGHGTFGGKFTITPSLCPGTAACSIGDAQIQIELTNQINSHVLPAPQTDAQGIINTYYAIYFPPNVTISLDPTTKSCVSGGFCAYHSNTGSLVPYGVMPDFSTGGCSVGCGSGTTFQIATAVSSHEMAEALTDPEVGSASVFGPPLGWYDNPPNLGEIADLCDPSRATVSAGSSTYTVEPLFSNLQGNCVVAPPLFSLSAPAVVTQAVSTNLILTIVNTATAGTLPGYVGTVHFTSSDALAILPADYTFTPADAGTHTFPIIMKTLGSQTITVTDVRLAGFTGTATFNVANGPDLVISKTHTGNFSVAQTGATYTIVILNAGNAATGAGNSVTVTDSLPAGLNATSFVGTGWTCNALPALSCTRSDSLAAGVGYPPLILTVDVTAASPTTVTNTATVSGGNDSNTNNNTALDATIIGPRLPSDLSITSFHGSAFIQGQTGVYTITVANFFGQGATFGQVTVTDTLPAGLTGASISGTGWSCSAPTAVPLTCTRSDVLPATGTYPQITLTVNVAANASSPLTNTATVSGGNDGNSANNTANDPTVIIVNGADLDIAPLSTFGVFDPGQTGAQALFVVANHGSAASSGTVTVNTTLSAGLTATAISGPGWTCTLATVSCTRSDSLPINMGFSAITVTFDVAKNAPANSTVTMSVSGGSDANTANNSGTFGVNVTQAINITLQGTGVATVNAGSSGTYILSLTLRPGAGTVSFSCSGLPTGAACTFNPPSLTASGSEVVTISTTARSASAPINFKLQVGGPVQLLLLAMALGALVLLALSKQSARRRFALGAASLVLLCLIGGCGGGGGSSFAGPTPTPIPTPTPNPNGTPAGTYGIIVTASGSSSSTTQSLTLVVK